ncbi:MAG: hypothetical protein M3Q10_10210, partial [Chloroflexota bacterium]|nr:hypothetical protein [Chloroflexota bacterium]
AGGGGQVSRRLLRCRNEACPEPYGAVLGRLTADGGLVLDQTVVAFRVYLDARRSSIVCPGCGRARDFRGSFLLRENGP